jgi:predicted RNA-binding protein
MKDYAKVTKSLLLIQNLLFFLEVATLTLKVQHSSGTFLVQIYVFPYALCINLYVQGRDIIAEIDELKRHGKGNCCNRLHYGVKMSFKARADEMKLIMGQNKELKRHDKGNCCNRLHYGVKMSLQAQADEMKLIMERVDKLEMRNDRIMARILLDNAKEVSFFGESIHLSSNLDLHRF